MGTVSTTVIPSKVTLVMVSSADGHITKHDDGRVYLWASPEDQAHFVALKDRADVIIMGSRTYLAAADVIQLQPSTLRVVMTQRPAEWQAKMVPGQLEFSDETPSELLRRLTEAGYTQILLVGGSVLNSAFLAAGLVDDLYLTVEPKVFGTGKHLASLPHQVQLELLETQQLNDQGTLVLHYRVLR